MREICKFLMIYERMLAVQIYINAYREDDKWAHG
jgi:hypothetical protein